MADCDEEWVCFQLAEHVECIHRCVTKSVQEIHQKPEELNYQKLHDILEEVLFLRIQLIGSLNALRYRVEGIEGRKQSRISPSTISSPGSPNSDLLKNLLIESEEDQKEEKEENQATENKEEPKTEEKQN